MGNLVVKNYPSRPAPWLADHTYVMCATGAKTWKCFGGNSGGRELARGPGSTRRANSIAGRKENGGLACYGINALCHQAANRILLPADIDVTGARGYDLSECLYGMYGRPRGFGRICKSPFRRHRAVTGDLAACAEGPDVRPAPRVVGRRREYVRRVRAAYQAIDRRADLSDPELEDFMVALFDMKLDFHLGDIRASTRDPLLDLRRRTERTLMVAAAWFMGGEMSLSAWMADHDREIEQFQLGVGALLTSGQYRRLLDQEPDEILRLVVPADARRAYPDR